MALEAPLPSGVRIQTPEEGHGAVGNDLQSSKRAIDSLQERPGFAFLLVVSRGELRHLVLRQIGTRRAHAPNAGIGRFIASSH